MDWTITLARDAEHDLVRVSYADVVLRNDADVRRWRTEVEARFARLGPGPFDTIISLDGLVVRPSASRAYGEQRAAIVARWVRRSYRVGGDAVTRTSVFTSAVLTGTHANVYATYDDALRALAADRARSRG